MCINQQQLKNILTELSMQRPIFHSEGDFQHALAWAIQSSLPDFRVRLEYPNQALTDSSHIDIAVSDNESSCYIEVKYKTKEFATIVNQETFTLRNHSALDFGRILFCKDIRDLEATKLDHEHISCFSLLLSNDKGYWSRGRENTHDANYRLHQFNANNQQRTLHGLLTWNVEPNKWADWVKRLQKRYRFPFTLNGHYNLVWENYSQLPAEQETIHEFKYLLLEI
jgi:hypothetical protein